MRPGRDADPSSPSSAEVKNRVELYLRAFVAYDRVKPTYNCEDPINLAHNRDQGESGALQDLVNYQLSQLQGISWETL